MASGYLLKFQEFLLLCTSGHFHWKSHIALITREMTMEDQVGSLSISRCSSTSSTCEAFPASSKASMHCKVQMSIYLDLPDFSISRFLDMFSICSRLLFRCPRLRRESASEPVVRPGRPPHSATTPSATEVVDRPAEKSTQRRPAAPSENKENRKLEQG